jgi:hypothetical protein
MRCPSILNDSSQQLFSSVRENRTKIVVVSAIVVSLAGTGYCLYRYQSRVTDAPQRFSEYVRNMEQWKALNEYKARLEAIWDQGLFKSFKEGLKDLSADLVAELESAAESAGYTLEEAIEHLDKKMAPKVPSQPKFPGDPSFNLEVVLPSVILWGVCGWVAVALVAKAKSHK